MVFYLVHLKFSLL